MLGKLFKYDLRALSRILILAHAPLLVLSLLARFFGIQRLIELEQPDAVAILLLLIWFIYCTSVSLLTQIYIAVYTYRKLYTHEGYLTLTLPVKPSTHILSKFLAGSVWILGSCVLAYLSLFIVTNVSELKVFFSNDTDAFASLFRFIGPHALGFLMLFSIVISALGQMAMLLGVLAFGHCFRKNRILIAVLSYFGITTVIQLISAGIGIYFSVRSSMFNLDAVETNLLLFDMYKVVFGSMILIYFVCGIFCYWLSYYVLKKKVNLD